MSEPKKYNTRDLYRFYRANKGTLCYEVFKKVVVAFNQELSVQIIKGYHFCIPYSLGIIKIIQNKRHISFKEDGTIVGAVDWKLSNELKAEILERGGILYKRNEDGTNNGGEQWLVYRTDPFYYTWIRLRDNTLANDNRLAYKFEATWHNQRALMACLDHESDLIYDKGKKGDSKEFLQLIRASA